MKKEDFTLKSKSFISDAGNIHVYRWVNTNGLSGIQLTVSRCAKDGSIIKETISFTDEIQAAEAGKILIQMSQETLQL
jgi:hypothetical protein